MSDTTWGFIGLGNIGYPMAVCLRKRMPPSYKLMILDMRTDVMKQFLNEAGNAYGNMTVGNGAREVAEKSPIFFKTVVITCLPSPQAVKDLFRSILQDGSLPSLERRRLFIDCSTIDPGSSREVANAVLEADAGYFVDAPVSGGVVGARAGTLSFMFGATKSEQLIERIESVLLLMGTTALHMGEQGAGVCSKLANNYILCLNNIAAAEALNLGQRWGLDLRALTDLIKSSTGRCWPVEVNNPVPGIDENAPSSRGYEGGGSVNIIKKDLGLAMAGAKASGAVLPLADRAYEVYQDVERIYDGKDFSVVYRWLQEQS